MIGLKNVLLFQWNVHHISNVKQYLLDPEILKLTLPATVGASAAVQFSNTFTNFRVFFILMPTVLRLA